MSEYRGSAFACYTKDNVLRMNSTSGGAFTEIAALVISRGGVVFGARFNQDFSVIHDYTQRIDELSAFRGSKYPQSDMGNNYLYVREFLKQGRYVLFSGTPCQIRGLLSFLGESPPKLICVDFICMGVASPEIWSQYLDVFWNKKRIQGIRFKDKEKGWRNWAFTIQTKCRMIRERGNNNVFMNLYVNGLIMRPSCYECHFKGMLRNSDFTISDCWGIHEIAPDFYDNRGTTGLFIHTQKGNEVWQEIKGMMHYMPVEGFTLLKYNPFALKSVELPAIRESIFSTLNTPERSSFLKFFSKKNHIYKILLILWHKLFVVLMNKVFKYKEIGNANEK